MYGTKYKRILWWINRLGMKEKLKVKYSYTIELRPTYEGIIGTFFCE
ncbi:hypothetical protein OESDEN_22951 [Oesophagostomum dentatum]|uniref:Uncharacterized protein n=1 Tax=Oesophagostomum dentatum TaxID=61180 RepID=A0A0B1RXL7_OESDE|nr:hypothetical protein OESDEN_22951 [Oesophagostomum dentatum]